MNRPIHSIKWAELPDTYTFIQKEDVVRYDAEQDLTEEEKTRVRTNLEIAEVVVEKDTEMSDTSTGMVENRVIKKYVDDMLAGIADSITGVVENTIFASISDGADNEPLAHMVTSLDYTQDLNGYANPYPIGANRNLYPQTLLEKGYYIKDDGTLGTSNIVDLSSYIRVTAGQTYTLSGTQAASSNSVKRISQYANGVFASQTKTTISAAGRYSINVTVGSGCDEVRFSIRNDDTDIQFEEGSTATDYVSGENYCPITGCSSVDIWRTGKNLVDFSRMCEGGNISYNSNRLTASYSDGVLTGVVQNNGQYTRDITVTMATSNQVVLPRGFVGYLTMSFRHEGMRPNSSNLLRAQLKYTNNATTFGNARYNESRYVLSTGRLSWAEGQTISGLYIAATYNASASIGDEIKFRDLQVEYADSNPSATEYEPANIAKYHIAFPNGTIVYGGTVDAVDGIMTVTHAALTLGASTVFTASGSAYSCAGVGTIQPLSGLHGTCSHFQYVGTQSAASDLSDDCAIGINATNGAVYIKASPFATAADLNAYLAAEETAGYPVTIVYEMDSPQTVQLEKMNIVTVFGENHLWSSAGTIKKLEYVVDTKTYIDSKFAALMALAST